MSRNTLTILDTQKMSDKDLNPFYKPKLFRFLLINLFIAVIMSFIFCTSCYSSIDRLDDALGGMLYSFMLSSSLSSGLGWLVNYNSTLIPWLKAPFKRLLLEIVTVFIYSFAASFVVIFSFHWFFGHFKMEKIPWDFLLMNTQYPIYVAYGITFFFTSRSFLQEWKEAAVDAEKLRTEQFAGKYRSLKDQLNPHFLFNSLNVLSNIVYEDQDKAVDFIQHLSRFYRYVLEVQKEEIVSLEREMDFGRRYLLLQQLRFGENLKTKLDVDPREGEFLPPLSLQLLLENALKHNEVSNENPMQLTILKEGSKIIIENQINPKAQVDESTGVGLTNIKERYRLLSKDEVVIKNDGKTFRVELPLLNLEN